MQKKDQIVSELTVYTLKLTSARDVDHIIEVVEGSDQDAWDAGYGIDSGHGTPDDVEIIARRPATIDDVQDLDEAGDEDAAYHAGLKRRAEMLAEIAASDAEYVTYGDGDLGVPVPRADAMDDIASMDPLSIGAGTWYPCDSKGRTGDDGEDDVSEEAREIVERGGYEAAVSLMDDGIRERLHAELAPCSDAAFLAAYMAAHKAAFGKDFVVA